MCATSQAPTTPDTAANEVITIGEPLGLLLADDGVPLRHARRFRRQVAGAELNVAVGLARLGHRCAFIGRVGDDPFGEDVLATLRTEGVEAAVNVDPSRPTGLLIRDFHGERRLRVLYHRYGSAGSQLARGDMNSAWLDRARLLHVTGITPALSTSAHSAVLSAVEAAEQRGVPISFDVNFRERLWNAQTAAPVLGALAARATIVLASEQEALWLSGCEDCDAAAAWFLERGAGIVAIKRGADGALVSDGRMSATVPALAVRSPVDPVGAGDAFDAGFLSGWLRAEELEVCARHGAAAGASCVLAAGDLDGLPTRDELDALLVGAPDVDR